MNVKILEGKSGKNHHDHEIGGGGGGGAKINYVNQKGEWDAE